MGRDPTRVAATFLLLALAAGNGCGGCGPSEHRVLDTSRPADILLGPEPSTPLATLITRTDWPAAPSCIQGPDDTIYLEYYCDLQGGQYQERTNPRRSFRSYRIGTQHR